MLNSLQRFRFADKLITMSNGFSIYEDDQRRVFFDIASINGHKLPDYCMFKRLQITEFFQNVKMEYVDSKIDCRFPGNLLEMLFFDNTLYMIEDHNNEFYKLSIIHFEDKTILSPCVIENWYKKLKSDNNKDTVLTIKEPNKWNLSYFELIKKHNNPDNIKKVSLSDLFGLAFSDTELYVCNTNLASKKVISITRDCSNDEKSWDKLIKTKPLAITDYRYVLMLENGTELYMFWTELSQILHDYVINWQGSEKITDEARKVTIYVPNYYQY